MVYNQKYAAQFMKNGNAPENIEEIRKEDVCTFFVTPTKDNTWYKTFVGPNGFDLGSRYFEVTYPGGDKMSWISAIDQEAFNAIWTGTKHPRIVAEAIWDAESHWALLNGQKQRDLVFFDQLDSDTQDMYLYLAHLFHIINTLNEVSQKTNIKCEINYIEISEGILQMLVATNYVETWPEFKLRPNINYLPTID